MSPNRTILDLARPRKSVVVVFGLLWTIILLYFVFLWLFPDGMPSPIHTALTVLLNALLAPMDVVQQPFEPMLEYDRLPGYVTVPVWSLYFYLLAVVMASSYETITDRARENHAS